MHDPWPRRERGSTVLNPFDGPLTEYDYDSGHGWEEDTIEPSPSPFVRPTPAGKDAVPAALAVGLRVAAWWLCRRPGTLPLLSALAVGAAAASGRVSCG